MHEGTPLNVSSRTVAIDLDSPVSPFGNCECMKGIDLDDLSGAANSFHVLPSAVLPSKGTKLVDSRDQAAIVRQNDLGGTTRARKVTEDTVKEVFASGLFSMSEIVFDKTHHYAIVSYAFLCGSLCGNGAGLVLEKDGNEWKITSRQCGGWVS